jgi:hypothetical protein
MRWLYLLLLACTVSTQAQQSNADSTWQEYFKNLPHYSLPGISDSALFKKMDRYLDHKQRWDSLEHLIDSLRRMEIPAYLCQVSRGGYSASNEAIFCWHNFSAIACSFLPALSEDAARPQCWIHRMGL